MAKGHIVERAIRRVERSLGERIPDARAATLIGLAVSPRSDSASVIGAARRLEARGSRGRALRLLRDAIVQRPTDPDLRYELGFLLERDGKMEAALKVYTDSIDLRPAAHNLYRRGRCHHMLGDLDAASTDFAHSLQFDQRDLRVHRALLDVNQSEPLWRRLEILEAANRATDVDSEWKATLASARYGMGHFGAAADLYAQLDADDPQDLYTLRYVECLYLAGHRLQARQAYRTRVPTLKNPERVPGGLGGYLQSLGRWSDAAREYERSLGSKPSPHALHQCGFAYLRSYQLAKALPLLSRASRAQEATASWALHEGMCLEKLERFDEAIDAYLWAHAQSGSAYHLYRAAVCAREVNSTERIELVADHLRDLLVSNQKEDLETPRVPSLSERAHVHEAQKRGARASLRKLAKQANRDGRYNEAISIFTWLCETEDALNPADHVELATARIGLGQDALALDAYIESRPFRAAHGLDESKLPSGLDRHHAVYIEFSESLPVNTNKVLYESNHGGALTCNVLPLLERNLDTERGRSQLHVVVLDDPWKAPSWLVEHDNVIRVKRNGHAYLKHLATAGWLINNNTFPPYFSRRPEQQYLNTWHGTPLKTLGRDIGSGMMDHRNAARNLLHATHLAMPNAHTARVIVDRYDVSGLYAGRLAITGYPRVDSTINLSSEREHAIRTLLPRKPIVMYAPTWRGTLEGKEFDTRRLVEDLKALSELPVHLIFKPHPLTEELLADIDYPGHAAPPGVDINELLAVTDVLITDYSSVLFDYYPTGRPVILYAYDEEEYLQDRGAYFKIEDIPGRVCRSSDDLTRAVATSLSPDATLEPGIIPVEEFCGLEDGRATDRVLSFFFEGETRWDIASEFSKAKRTEILFFAGSFIPNGITNSFSALANKLINSTRYNVSVVCQPEAVFSKPQNLDKFWQLPDQLRAFGRVGTMAATAEEQWLIDRFNSLHEFFSEEHQQRVHKAFRREFRRMFGHAKFHHTVCFEGYARFWAVLLASVGETGPSTHIYLHSDMTHEKNARFRYLDGIFALYSTFDSLISVSDSVNEVNRIKLSSRYDLNPEKMVAVRNMIDYKDILERASNGETLALPWEGDGQSKTFVSTGRLAREKGHDLLLEAFANVSKKHPEAKLIIVGDGPLAAQMRSFVEARNLSARVVLPGYMANPLGVVAQADCFVFPSRYEGQGLSLVEGLVLGLPGIGTDVVGVRSVLAGGEGRLVDLSVAGLEEGLLAFLTGQPMASKDFDPDSYVSTAMSEFEAALGVQEVG